MSNPAAAIRPTGTRAAGLLIAGYAACVYLFFILVLDYGIGFFADFAVGRSIDTGPGTSVSGAVVVDLLLLMLFAAQHSIMARAGFKRVWTRVVPVPAERATYVLATSLVLALFYWRWRPIDTVIWHAPTGLAVLLWAGYGFGWALVTAATFLISHGDLFGVRQAWYRLRGLTYRPPGFTERGLYRYVRHPLMAGFVVVFWSTPKMTAGHLLFAVAATGYILLGISFEERDLIRGLGQSYADYRARVPALLPVRLRRSAGPGG